MSKSEKMVEQRALREYLEERQRLMLLVRNAYLDIDQIMAIVQKLFVIATEGPSAEPGSMQEALYKLHRDVIDETDDMLIIGLVQKAAALQDAIMGADAENGGEWFGLYTPPPEEEQPQ